MQVNHVEQGHHDESDCGKSKQDVEIVWGHLLFSFCVECEIRSDRRTGCQSRDRSRSGLQRIPAPPDHGSAMPRRARR